MKREILKIDRFATDCCPGHSKWPDDSYRNRRSKKARSRDKAKEHRYARHIAKNSIFTDI